MKNLIKHFKDTHPIGQSFHTGLWGFERAMDCLDLNKCIYKTERSAQIARAKAAKESVEMQIAMDEYYHEESREPVIRRTAGTY